MPEITVEFSLKTIVQITDTILLHLSFSIFKKF